MTTTTNVKCINCSMWFDMQVRIEIEKIQWDSETSAFTVYGKSFYCTRCGNRNKTGPKILLDDPKEWWEKWKTIPISTMKPAECPMCGSDEISIKSIDTSKENGDVIIVATFICKKCNGNRQQFIRGIKDFWQRVKSISIGPAEVTLS